MSEICDRIGTLTGCWLCVCVPFSHHGDGASLNVHKEGFLFAIVINQSLLRTSDTFVSLHQSPTPKCIRHIISLLPNVVTPTATSVL